MSVFKCKMCGGTIEFEKGATIGVCDSCGTKQTLPRLDDDKRTQLFERANEYRRANEYDKAMGIYEIVLSEAQDDAEAYWSLVLCQYGIEYVEDPMSHKRIPTVNRAQFTSIFEDANYCKALEYADSQQKELYEEEAKTIDDIQKNILEISSKEDPFDVFICYKESDENGRRTQDSVQAMELYKALEKENFKVFFSRVTLEEKLGTAFEPYIFAALNSAKVMVAIGSKPEYFNAVWVKNEWSRYVALVREDNTRTLIPAYFGMDPKFLPKEFSNLQAQDLSKVGAIQDIVHGIEKLLGKNSVGKNAVETNSAVQGLLESVYAEALNAMNSAKTGEEFISASREFAKILGYKDSQTLYDKCLDMPNNIAYSDGICKMNKAKNEAEFTKASKVFEGIKNYKDSQKLYEECLNKANECKEKKKKFAKKGMIVTAIIIAGIVCCAGVFAFCKNIIIPEIKYRKAIKFLNVGKYVDAISVFEALDGYKDSTMYATDALSQKQISELTNASVGSTIKLGTYEQDNNASNGNEEIEWQVLAKEGTKMLLISKFALDCQRYNASYTDVTWETSSLRSWLNETFYNNAFDSTVKSIIEKTTVSADKNPNFSTNPGNATSDNVFLLSITEVNKYFSSNKERVCVPTAYAKAQGAYDGWWWLRSPGDAQNGAALVNYLGAVYYYGGSVTIAHDCVRPALWINLE